MIEADKRKAIFVLHQQGLSNRKIAQDLRVGRNTIRKIIEQKGQVFSNDKNTKIDVAPELLKELYADCDGWSQRVYEKLTLEHGVKIGYSTLTERLRELEISKRTQPKRAMRVADKPGAEVQHDTSDYKVSLSGISTKVIGSLLYYRYSKVRYLKFYPFFNRFMMKCFFFEALKYFGYVAPKCVIDNTHLAVLHGTGKNAVFVPEMIRFAEQFGFKWMAHERGHSDRKAGNERSFFTVESNFFPGRKFESFEDLNKQAFKWATQIFASRPLSKTRLIPIQLFEQEKPELKKLPLYVHPPYLQHHRKTDQYGYIAFEANHYWIPGTSREKVIILQYADHIRIYRRRTLLIDYPLPPHGTRNQLFKPDGIEELPYQPTFRPRPTEQEQKKLRSISPEVSGFIDFALTQKRSPTAKHRMIRAMDRLCRNTSPDIFQNTIKRAHQYRITDSETIERIASQLMKLESYELPFVEEIDEEKLKSRDAYLEGQFSDYPDLGHYDRFLEHEIKRRDPNEKDDKEKQ